MTFRIVARLFGLYCSLLITHSSLLIFPRVPQDLPELLVGLGWRIGEQPLHIQPEAFQHIRTEDPIGAPRAPIHTVLPPSDRTPPDSGGGPRSSIPAFLPPGRVASSQSSPGAGCPGRRSPRPDPALYICCTCPMPEGELCSRFNYTNSVYVLQHKFCETASDPLNKKAGTPNL